VRAFDYKDTLEDKKAKLVAPKHRKHASFSWTKLYAKMVKKRKGKIRTWAKMKPKLRGRFLLLSYL